MYVYYFEGNPAYLVSEQEYRGVMYCNECCWMVPGTVDPQED